METFIQTIEQAQLKVGNLYHLSLEGNEPLQSESYFEEKWQLGSNSRWEHPWIVDGHEVSVVLFTRDAIGGTVPITHLVLSHFEFDAVLLDISIDTEIVSFLVDSSLIKGTIASFYHRFRNYWDGNSRFCGKLAITFEQAGYNCSAVLQTIDANNSSASYVAVTPHTSGQHGVKCTCVINLMMLNIPCGAIIRFTICGPDSNRMAELLSQFEWEFIECQQAPLTNPEVRVISTDDNPVTVYTTLDYDIPTGEFTFHTESLYRLMYP